MRWSRLPLALALVGMLAGCFGDSSPPSDARSGDCISEQDATRQLAVCNYRDTFSFAVQTSGWSHNATYAWNTSQPHAVVAFGGQRASGNVSLSIIDASSSNLYVRQFSATATEGVHETMGPGMVGIWTIQVGLAGLVGQASLVINATPDNS